VCKIALQGDATRHYLKGDFAHAHAIRDDADFERRVDYIRFNPVKHGYVKTDLLPAGLGRRSERDRVRKIALALCRGSSACQAILHTLRSWQRRRRAAFTPPHG